MNVRNLPALAVGEGSMYHSTRKTKMVVEDSKGMKRT
ncbi:hypothetical protein METP2_02601 [Methanosarcinales archaeon]|nr:hypothetical protein METP2_02601 [Methanosarcinales archaeon]